MSSNKTQCSNKCNLCVFTSETMQAVQLYLQLSGFLSLNSITMSLQEGEQCLS